MSTLCSDKQPYLTCKKKERQQRKGRKKNLNVENLLTKTSLPSWTSRCVFTGLAQFTWTSRFTPITPSVKRDMLKDGARGGETSLKVFYEKASTFFSNDPIYTAVCGGKEPLREESLITGTQCPEGALQFKTVPSISTHTTLNPVCLPLSWLHEKNPLLKMPEDR